jgi:hypothetical protein
MASQKEALDNPKFKPIDLASLERDNRSLKQRKDDEIYEEKVNKLNIYMHM